MKSAPAVAGSPPAVGTAGGELFAVRSKFSETPVVLFDSETLRRNPVERAEIERVRLDRA
ncbi:hypothetical protein GCM10023319_45750 [Nocardia iowensis]